MPNKEETKRKKKALHKANIRLIQAHKEELERYMREELEKEGLNQ